MPDDDNADTNNETQVTILNEKMAREIIKGDAIDFRSSADWAATVKHEYVHLGQTTKEIIASNVMYEAGGACPHELKGWAVGFQSYLRWIFKLNQKGGTEADREEAAEETRGLCQGFLEYQQNFLQRKFGTLSLTGENGETLTLDEAADDVNVILAAANSMLERSGFKVVTNPRVCKPQAGDEFTLTASIRGADPKGSFIYRWYADGVRIPVPETTNVLTRTATKSEKIQLEAQDYLSRKRSFTCVVTVSEKKKETANTAIAGSQSGVAEWGCHHLSYTISGAALNTPPALTSTKFWDVYTYSGEIGRVGVLTVSGTAISDNPTTSEAAYYMIAVSVSAGKASKTFEYRAPVGEKLNKPFSVSVVIPDDVTSGHFNMTLTQVNANYGNRGVAVDGELIVEP